MHEIRGAGVKSVVCVCDLFLLFVSVWVYECVGVCECVDMWVCVSECEFKCV